MDKAYANLQKAIENLKYRADLSALQTVVDEANSLDMDRYILDEAFQTFNGVLEDAETMLGNPEAGQEEVDAMAKAIEDAIAALQYKDADYTKVDAAIAKANALKKDDYKDFSGVEAAVKAVVRGKNIT